jgi:hypothetical protein
MNELMHGEVAVDQPPRRVIGAHIKRSFFLCFDQSVGFRVE